MVKHLNTNGLVLNFIQLKGTLELRFTADNTFAALHTLHGADNDNTVQMEYAREAAYEQHIVSLSLELFLKKLTANLSSTSEA